jgi:sodium/bile acid cotransporter 7
VRRVVGIVILGVLFALGLIYLPGLWRDEKVDSPTLDRIHQMYEDYKKSFPDTPDVTVEELLSMLESRDVVIVDKRDTKEQAVSMLPGAIPSREFETNLEAYKDKSIVVYCTIGARSGRFTKRLREQGLEAYNLKGSILAWIHAGQPVVDENGETKRVHVYGRKWDLVPSGYEAVW